MKLGIMQPYFLPYLGYWQLLNEVDRFVIYDDVNYIKQGWVNRNRILINNSASYITIPLAGSSSFKKICDIRLNSANNWRDKLLKTIENTYRRAPFFSEVYPVIETIIRYDTDGLSQYLEHSIRCVSSYLCIDTDIVSTSRKYQNSALTGQERVLDICILESADVYINLQGGQALYDLKTFRKSNIDLKFIFMHTKEYKQRSPGFVPYLSILDMIMELGKSCIDKNLNDYDLVGL